MIKGGQRTARHLNLYLGGTGEENGGGILMQWSNTLLPDLDSSTRGIGFQGTTPKYWNGTSWAAFSGGSGYTTWDELYANDKTLTIDSTTLSFSLTHATNNGLTLLASGGSAGHALQITNSGSGKDINATNWSIAATGAAVLASTITTTGVIGATNLLLDATGAGTIQLGATSTGDIQLKRNTSLAASKTLTLAGAGGSTILTLTAGDISVVDGSLTIVDADNAATVSITNDTATDLGAAADTGVIHASSESITTGVLMNLSLDETPLAGGYFFRCYSQDAGAAAFTIGEKGATVIAGVASGTAALTLTAGNLVLTSGDQTVSEGSISITNTANETAFTIVADSVTDGIVVDINADGITSGTILHLDSTAAGFTGKYIDCFDGAASDFAVGLYGATTIAGNAATTVFTITAGHAVLTSGNLTLTSGNIVQTAGNNTMTLGDLTLSNGSISITNTADETALTIVGDSVASGILIDINADGITDGTILHLDSTVAGMTTGLFIDCFDGAASAFSVGKYGATVIAGTAATNVFTITAGHAVLTSGNLTLTAGNAVLTNGNLTLTSGNALLSSGNLTLTNGTFTITAGSAVLTAGNLTLTDGDITLTDGFIKGTPQALVGAGAVDVTHLVTTVDTTGGAAALTLADGATGQIKMITMITDAGDGTLTPTNLAGGTTITFNDVGDSVILIFVDSEWQILSNNGCTVA